MFSEMFDCTSTLVRIQIAGQQKERYRRSCFWYALLSCISVQSSSVLSNGSAVCDIADVVNRALRAAVDARAFLQNIRPFLQREEAMRAVPDADVQKSARASWA